ncbi:Putative multidrug resistance protein MdtD [uncultured archaeon]|nr:Putative multidrug resistance protein MdtD [uncultured archaeon]
MEICSDAKTKDCALIIATLTSFLPPFMVSSINIALPAIGAEFSMNAVLLGWIATSYLLSSAVFMVPLGKIADIYGMKRIFQIGLFIFTVSSLVAFFAPSASILIAARVLQGIGSAMIFGTGTAILVNVFPLRERGKVLGINAASVYLGLSLGPFLGGLLTSFFGWRSLFLINVPLGLIPLALALWKLEGEWAGASEERFDLVGSLIYSLMLIAVMYGFSLLPSPEGAALVLAGIGTLFLLIRWESRVACPVLDVTPFKSNRVYAFSNLAAMINYSATFAVTFLLSLYLQYIKGMPPDQAGLILVAQPLVMTVLSPYTGRLSDRVEPRVLATAGMALTFVGILTFVLLSQETSILSIVASLLILGLGLSLFTSPNTNAIMSSIEPRCYGVGSAMLGTMRLVGQVSSMGIAMLVFSVFMGRVQIVPEYYPQFLICVKVAFAIFSVLCVVGIFASMARGSLRENQSENL